MSSLNQITLVGRLSRDPEVRSMQSGRKLANLGVATTEHIKDAKGARREKTQWHNVAVFNQATVDFAGKYLKKGCLVAVTGQLEYRRYKRQDGIEVTAAEIVVGAYDGDVKLLARPMGEAKPAAADPQAAGEPLSDAAAAAETDGADARAPQGEAEAHDRTEHAEADGHRDEAPRKVSAKDLSDDSIPF